MTGKLAGKMVLITGASAGIGCASAVVPACTQSAKSRIIEVQMRKLDEPLA